MAQLRALSAHRPLPLHLERLIEEGAWSGIIRAFDDGLAPNLVYEDDQTLFGAITYVLAETGQRGTTSAAYGPLALVDAFLRHGLQDVLMPAHITTVVDVVASGQWAWIDPLLAAGHRVELPHGRSVLHALVEGRMARRLRDREDQWDEDETRLNLFPFNADLPAEVDQVRRAVALLVEKGARIDALDDEGGASAPLTPLMLAVQYNDHVVAEALLHAGACIGLDPGEDPMGINQEHPFALAVLPGLDRVLDLLLAHSGLDVLGHHGVDAMHLAASRGYVSCMRILHDHGIDYTAPTRMGQYTPLHQAALHGRAEAIKFLLDHGARWEDGKQEGMSAGAVLSTHHPTLARQYAVPVESGNVVPLRIRVRGVAKGT